MEDSEVRGYLSMNRIDVGKGFVELVDYIGDDYLVLRAARTSTGADYSKGEVKDRGLIRYLYRNEHMSPFEFPTLIWHVKCPIFVARQYMRHRAFSFNEASGRYKELDAEMYEPESWRRQDTENKQGSIDELDFQDTVDEAYWLIDSAYNRATSVYHTLLEDGVAREQARTVLPMGTYTEFYVRTDLRNLLHFLELRMDSHAQKEIQDIADAMYTLLSNTGDFAWTLEIFDEIREVKGSLGRLMNEHKHDMKELVYKLRSL